jgi:ABC-type cobalamin/Fe3+-siderophores transport system ATPase subunit
MIKASLLEIQFLSVAYADRMVLKDISLSLDPGSVLVIIGPNGAGKTTLIRALSGVIPIQSGKVTVDGNELVGMSEPERARKIAVVPQARNLPPAFTGWEIVLLGRTPHINWFGQTSLEDENIVRKSMVLTDTFDLADRRVGELSGGEQQRLLLARALAQQASILLLDEPVTHLDLHYQISILDQIRSLAKGGGLGVLAVLHDLNMAARFADKAALLVNGEIRALGSPEEVLTPALLSDAYSLPMEVFRHFSPGEPVFTP